MAFAKAVLERSFWLGVLGTFLRSYINCTQAKGFFSANFGSFATECFGVSSIFCKEMV